MSRHKASKKCMISYICLLVMVVLIVSFTLIHHSIKVHLAELCKYKCGEIVNNILADTSIYAASLGLDLYDITKDSDGRILSVNANSQAVNQLQGYIRRAVNERLSSKEYDKIMLTLGDLTDIAYFSGRGPDISINYQQSGTAGTKLETSFESAGINQTRFKVSIMVSVEFTAFLPTGEENITISQEYTAADTVIVGQVPECYFQA